MNIATVVEGATDFLVLEAVLNQILPDISTLLPLYPPAQLGVGGGGWRGVRWWCQTDGHDLQSVINPLQGIPLDLLIIQLDADVVRQSDLQNTAVRYVFDVAQPCPPIAPTIDKLRQVVLNWLGITQNDLPFEVVIAIPSQDIENWVFATLFPNDPLCHQPDYECIHATGSSHPAYRLTLKKYTSPSGKRLAAGQNIKKTTREYAKNRGTIAAGWQEACVICTQAQRFHDDVSARG